ncbi:host-nuclease inhibitor Gam family protein [Geminisphaera colitermitum]|uniref:host-nuclease inhibitor Gam family protein n=1 Tax=Geminisphaera colitermitum TaxID=1148786 RepID=UPI0001964DF6|nr:host-nuclease inhibitor Gam family protein [Geminisphaera colitermitum]
MPTIAQSPTPLELIDVHAKAYAEARRVLAERTAALEDEVRDAHRRKRPGIKTALAIAQDTQANLSAAIQSHPELFERPRTMTLHGVKIGFQKGKGKLTWDDEESVVVRIEKMFGLDADAYLVIKKKPSATALGNLETRELAKLGVTVETTGDQVFIKTSDSAVDKLVKKLLKEGAVEEAEESGSS